MSKVTFVGHACVLAESSQGKVIIDPFLTGNPQAALNAGDVEADAILVTHGHGDHLGDAIEISRRTGAVIIGTAELAEYCAAQGATVHPMHIGGSREFPFGWVKLVPAWHGSAVMGPKGNIYTGTPCGFLLRQDGKTIYHLGDTGLFSDLKMIGERNQIDCALVPIGDNYVMGPDDAAQAADWLNARLTVPIHYNTFDLIRQDPLEFKHKVQGNTRVVILAPGEQLDL